MLNDKGERELAYVARVTEIIPIESADRVEIAKIQGWTCLVAKGAFKVGDLGVFFEADAKVPATEPFAFMEKRNYKVKVQKFFKGTVISDGLLMAFADFGWAEDKYNEGDFLTKELGVTYAEAEDNSRKAASVDKYKRMAQRRPDLFKKSWARWMMKRNWGRKIMFFFFGKKKDKKSGWPAWVVKTDEERIQNLASKISDFRQELWIPTEKIDGTSTTFTAHRKFLGHDFYVCSRNIVFDKPNKKCFYETNVYVEMAEKYHIEEVLVKMFEKYPHAKWITIQGETYGEGIQKREYSIKGHDFKAFNLIIDGIGRINTYDMADVLFEYGVPCVPFFEPIQLPETCDEILAMAAGESALDGLPREGLVFRSLDGMKSFKSVDSDFLIKFHG